MAIRTRRPTGVAPYPLILIEGPEFSGKTHAAAEFTACDKVGQCYWLDLGEGSADEFARLPGADYLIVEHDGTWHDIVGQVTEIHKAAAQSEKPVVLIIDSMTAEWELLKDWASMRARESKFAQKKLREDPNAEIKPSMNLWNDAGDRHHQLMRLLMTFPGIVVMTARGKEVAALDSDGKPIPNAKEYRVEGHKTLPFDASVWVRLSRDEPPTVIGCRSVHSGLRPGVDKPLRYPEFSLEHLIFDVLKINPAEAQAREVTDLVADELALANQARSALGDFLRLHNIKYPPVKERFYSERGEDLEACMDPTAIFDFLAALKKEKAA